MTEAPALNNNTVIRAKKSASCSATRKGSRQTKQRCDTNCDTTCVSVSCRSFSKLEKKRRWRQTMLSVFLISRATRASFRASRLNPAGAKPARE